MPTQKSAFTLIEVLISVTLLSLVLMTLYKSTDLLNRSNKHLYKHLEDASSAIKGSQTLYRDILQSDGNITINQDKEFHHLIIEKSSHSLYGLPRAKVAWLVYKEDNTLLRVEGNGYNLPLKSEQQVEIDPVLQNLELFKVYPSKNRDSILILMKLEGREPQSFMVQNLTQSQ